MLQGKTKEQSVTVLNRLKNWIVVEMWTAGQENNYYMFNY